MGDWANLPTDIMLLIIQCLQHMDDFVALGFVCKSWQIITSMVDNIPSLPPRAPIVLLYPGAASRKLPKCYPRIATLSCEFKLTKPTGKRLLGTCRGWLLTAHYNNTNLNLIHPFSRQQIDLPRLDAFKDEPIYLKPPTRFRSGLVKLAMSGNPLDENAKVDCVILVTHSRHPFLAFARIGDQVWTSIITPYRKDYQDVVHYKGVFYAVDDDGTLFICNINSDNENAPISITARTDPPDIDFFTSTTRCVKSKYLVESSGDLLLVSRLHTDDRTTNAISVYKLERKKDARGVARYSHRWKEVQNLGSRALFVGANASVSVHPSKHVNADCVYFYGDDFHTVRCDSGVYNTTEKNIESFNHVTQLRCPKRPLWYF